MTTPTSPTPADQLRAAAGHASSPELARLLETLADASDHHPTGEGGAVATLVHPALAVARQLLGISVAEGDRRCVCGDPIEWMTHPDGSGWIHSPGSDTRCLDARPVAAPPAPADRAAVLTEAAEVAAAFRSDCQNCAVELEVATELRSLADRAAAGVQPPTSEATCSFRLEHRLPGDNTWRIGTPRNRGHWSWQSREKADQRLAEARDRWPDFEHRLIETTTTVTEQPAAPAAPEETLLAAAATRFPPTGSF